MNKFETSTLVLFIVFTCFIILFTYYIGVYRKRVIKKKIISLTNNLREMSPKELMELRKHSPGARGKTPETLISNFAGVYILYNHTKKMYYVGQAKKILDRVNLHFTGRGNGDVYADYKYGDQFTIKIIPLENSGYTTLNKLEKNTIMTFNSYSKGYNKTRGNSE